MSYAVISVAGKQYRVSEGETLLVNRIAEDEGATLTLTPMLLGGDGNTDLTPGGATVTARVVEHVLGEKIRIGKYKRRKGYKRHAGHRSRLSRIRIETIAAEKARSTRRRKADAPAEPAADTTTEES